MSLKISFVTTCKGRLQHLRETLPQNIKDNADYPNLEFVVVDYNSTDGLEEYIKENFQAEIQSGQLRYVRYPEPEHFHMAHAKNMAHRMATGDVICNIDADNFTKKGFAAYLNEGFNKQKDFFFRAAKKYRRLNPDTSLGGRIALRRTDFLTIGGYNENTQGWGPENSDLVSRLGNIGLQEVEIPPKYLKCIIHNDELRSANYAYGQSAQTSDHEEGDIQIFDHEEDSRKVSTLQNILELPWDTSKTHHGESTTTLRENVISYRGRHLVTLQNEGSIGCGDVYINNDSQLTHLGRLPTRIFGIGWHKSGTTSLHAAMQELGFNSAHWVHKMYPEILAGRFNFSAVNNHYALCDFPIPLVFPKLDLAYPGSKFILTTRSTDSFLNSAEKHWEIGMRKKSPDSPKTQWDVVSKRTFSHEIHTMAYGQKHFDRNVFAERFERHNDEVRQYFFDRPDDLLVIDLDEGAKWEPLCEFLRQSGFIDLQTPQTPYPHLLKTKDRLDRDGSVVQAM